MLLKRLYVPFAQEIEGGLKYLNRMSFSRAYTPLLSVATIMYDQYFHL